MAVNLLSANRQWANRPNDERFWGLSDLQNHLQSQFEHAKEATTELKRLRVENHNDELCVVGTKNNPAKLSHWAFSQFSGFCGAPANYLRSLPADLACQNLNYGLQNIDNDVRGKFLFNVNGSLTARAITGPEYGRIWNIDVVNKLTPALSSGWMVPPARPANDTDSRARPATANDIVPGQDDFGLSVKVGDMIAPAGVYCGDRDMFIFMVNPNRIIDDGGQGLMRGVFVWNSEVGLGAFKVRSFFLENVCGNHIVWNASGIQEIKIVHRKNSIIGFDQKALRQLREYADMSAKTEQDMILTARNRVLGENREEVIEALFSMKSLAISKKDIEASYDTAEKWEHTALSPPTTVWGMVHGITRYSQTFPYADERNKLDNAAGKLLATAV